MGSLPTESPSPQASSAASAAIAGIGVGLGIAHGPVARMAPAPQPPENVASVREESEEHSRVTESVTFVATDLAQRGEQAGGQAKDVLEAQAMMAQDPMLAEAIAQRLSQGKTAEWAVHDAFMEFMETMQSLGGYLGERAADLADVAARVVAHLRGLPAPGVPDPGHPFILVAEDLAPADTALLDLDKVLALVTIQGGPTSHTAILAREKSITAVVGATAAADLAGEDYVIVDAEAGQIILNPDDASLAAADARVAERAAIAQAPITPGALADGTPVPLLANLGNPEAAVEAVAKGAEGVGLFRTEFLFLSSDRAPSVEEQTQAYTQLLQAFPQQKVVVRALDAGADKPLSFLNDDDEENPALGQRGWRALEAHPEVLDAQLQALAQAQEATDADLWVMAPMVSTVEESARFAEIARQHGLKTVGVMIEVPSSAIMAESILQEVDFASIGTNDLTQYTLAADRLLGSVAHLQDSWHPAVLRLIREVGIAGTTTGKPVGVCGEAASDPLLAVVLVGLGVTTLSMAPAALAEVRAQLKKVTAEQATAIAEAVLTTTNPADARAAAHEGLRGL